MSRTDHAKSRSNRSSRAAILAFVAPGIACLAVPIAGCTRTYDGTIVPLYAPKIAGDGAGPIVVIEEAEVAPPNRMQRFPPAPPPLPGAAAVTASGSGAIRVRPALRSPSAPSPTRTAVPIRRDVNCENVAAVDGRIKLVCT